MEVRFVKFLWKYGELRPRDFFRLFKGIFQTNGQSPLLANKAYLKNKNLERYQILARDCFEQAIKPNLLPRALERMLWHQEQGTLRSPAVRLVRNLSRTTRPSRSRLFASRSKIAKRWKNSAGENRWRASLRRSQSEYVPSPESIQKIRFITLLRVRQSLHGSSFAEPCRESGSDKP